MVRFLFYRYLTLAVCAAGVFGSGAAFAQDEAESKDEQVAPRVGTVTATVLNVRARPARHYETVAQLRRGDEVQIVDETDDWYEIVLGTQAKAWIAARFVGEGAAITGSRVRVHSGPGLVFTTFAYVNKDDKVELIGEAVNGWQRIAPPAAATAWISKGFVDIPEPPPVEVVAATPDAVEGVATDDPDTAKGVATGDVQVAADTATAADAAGGETPPSEGTADTDTGGGETGDATTAAAVASPDTDGGTGEVVALAETPPEESVAAAVEEATSDHEPPKYPTLPAYQPRPVIKEGIVLSLRHAATEAASHVLTIRVGFTCYTLCFLQSDDLNLTEWEHREVRIQGDELWYRGWKRPVVRVSSIQIKPAY
ncbi:MAG: SH3 domain-containing protein [Lentisphaerae bacterium]|jgi:SH3-like domain-containing protein|nr:SH3 domain-containing protein [Lentisphaerota bacterium]MBT4822044.1 SH3 domain-containing protein [Lentisphaerota bacterium]MBT5605005.1 SH3 domain-containing protein [Lentisphaerota bacterium]MBT7054635.1 SH3 domain-containing protein [Lentisphaerota bacterium]MBT7844664.1 SH3 domain-containing protein [Lentisphaerota bacterium]